MFENPRRGRQARNFGKNVPKILDLKSSFEQIFSENCRWVPLMEVISRLYESGGFFYVIGRVLNRVQIPLLLFRPCKQILNTCFSFPANGSSQRVMHERVHRFSYQNSACLTTLDCHVHQSSRHVILILYLDWVITCFGLRIKTFP